MAVSGNVNFLSESGDIVFQFELSPLEDRVMITYNVDAQRIMIETSSLTEDSVSSILSSCKKIELTWVSKTVAVKSGTFFSSLNTITGAWSISCELE